MKIPIIGSISNKWLLIILLAALIEPIHYFFLTNYPLEGKAFLAYDSDEATVMGVMRSPEFGFDNPWSKGEKVFFNGALTSPYAYIPLGYVRMLLNIDPLLMNIAAKSVLFFIFLTVLFKAMESMMPRRHELAFTFFLLPIGFMPFGYMLYGATGIERFAEGFSFEFSILNNFSRIYYYIPMIFGLLSLIFLSKGRKKETTLFLGLTFLFYPFFGFAFAGLMLLYVISGKHGSINEKGKQALEDLWRVYAIAAAFLIPWLYVRLAQPQYFNLYSQNSLWWKANLVGIVGSYFFLLAIILLANFRTASRYWKLLAIAGLLALITIIGELKVLGVPPFAGLGIPDVTSEAVNLLLLILFAAAWLVLDINMDRRQKFIILFALAFVPLSILSPRFFFFGQYRMGYILHIPIAMLAALYFDQFIEKIKSFGINRMAAVTVIALIAVSSFAAYNYRYQMVDRWLGLTYMEKSDLDAMKFLDAFPPANTLASDQTNYFLPVWSGQYALYHPAESQYIGGGPDRVEKKETIQKLYAGKLQQGEIRQFLNDHGVKYVFYGSEERKIGFFDPEYYTFLKKIYDNGETSVYEVVS